MPARDWNEHYEQGAMPWDTETPDQGLVDFVRGRRLVPGRALDIGCGTGTHALWLAGQGWDVLGVDISPRAIERAHTRAAEATVTGRIRSGGRCSLRVPAMGPAIAVGMYRTASSPTAAWPPTSSR